MRSDPFDDPMPRIVPGEVVASRPIDLPGARSRPTPFPRARPAGPAPTEPTATATGPAHPGAGADGTEPVRDATGADGEPGPANPSGPSGEPPAPSPSPPSPAGPASAPDGPAPPTSGAATSPSSGSTPPSDPAGTASASDAAAPTGTARVIPRPARTEPEQGPRVAILTLRELRPFTGADADYGGLHDAEDVLVEALSAGLYRVVLSSPRFGRPPFDRPMLRRALNTSRVVQPFRIEHHGQGGANAAADVLVVLARDLADAAALIGVPRWYELGRTVIVHVNAVTERDLRRYPELVVQLRRRVDALFSATEMPPLGHLRSERLATLGVVPPLLDVLAFPLYDDRERSIDVFSPDARPPGQDRLLRHWADQHAGNYQQGVGQLGAITSHGQRRKVYTSMAARSRLFLTNFDQFDHRRHAGAHREVGARFYDAMAAGCVLFGDLPSGSRQFHERVVPAGPLSLPLSAQQLPTEIRAALDDRAESGRLGAIARAAALRGADVAHRWSDMITLAGLPNSPGILARINHLATLAETSGPSPRTESPTPGKTPAHDP